MASKREEIERAESPSVLGALSPGNILRTVQEPVTAKSHDTTTHETAARGDYAVKGHDTADKMREYKDSTAQKAYETKDAAAQKAGETTESTKSKAGEYTDYAAHKARDAKDTTAQKAGEYGDNASQTAREAKDTTTQKAGEYKDAAAQKAVEAKNTTVEKAGEYKDAAAQNAAEAKDAVAEKAKQTKDHTVDKAGETKDYTGSKITELKDSVAGATRRAIDLLIGKKEEVKEKTAETGEEAKIKYNETEEKARRKMEEMKLGDDKYKEDKDEEGRMAGKPGGLMEHRSEVASDRGTAGKSNIMGAIGSITGAIKEKLAGPKDIGEQTRERREQEEGEGRDVKTVLVDVEKTRPGEVASKLKAADQMTGQAFNDVGRMGDETVVRVERPGKM